MQCPYCNAKYTNKMLDVFNSSYGCDTGCDYVRIVIECESCKKVIYVKGEFGEFENDEEKNDILEEVTEDDIKSALIDPEDSDVYF